MMPKGFTAADRFREDFAEPTELWVPLVLEVIRERARQSWLLPGSSRRA